MTVTKNKFTVDLQISEMLYEALQPQEVQSLIDDLMMDVCRFIYGDYEGMNKKYSVIGRHFISTNQANYGFKPLTPKYAKWKQKKVGNKPILVFSGKWAKEALKCRVRKVGKDKYVIEPINPPKYAKYHEKGEKPQPKRPAFTLNPEDKKAVYKFAQKRAGELFGELAQVGNMVSRI